MMGTKTTWQLAAVVGFIVALICVVNLNIIAGIGWTCYALLCMARGLEP